MRTAVRWLLVVVIAAAARVADCDTNNPHGFGARVKALGDLSGDGVPDFAVVTGGDDPSVFVYSGRDGAPLWKSEGGSFDVAAIPDWNGDGKPDAVIAMPGTVDIGGKTGWLEVVDGKTGKHLGMIEPEKPPAGVKPNVVAVIACGDVDGDGKPDLVVVRATPSVRPNGSPDSSRWCGEAAAFVISTDGRIIADLHPYVDLARRSFLVTPVGDVDGDGKADLFVTLSGNSTASCLRLTSPTKGDLAGFKCDQTHLIDCVAVLPDIDGDGKPDFVFGASATGRDATGEAWIASSKDGKALLTVKGQKEERLGRSVAALGDVDGDGVPDFAVGAPGFSAGKKSPNVGAVKAISGKTGKTLWTVQGTLAGAELGTTLTAIGDVDGDGVGDIVAGAPLGGKGSYALLLSGKTGKIIATVR